jgi:hypothetical protein
MKVADKLHGSSGACAPLLVLALLAGCKGDGAGTDEGSIDQPSLRVLNPDAAAPTVIFPHRLKTDDVTLNEFIHHALEVCAEGDYDKFRELFGTAYRPPGKEQFERVWQGVREVAVVGVYPDRQEPPEYYVHAVVELRKPDRRERTQRDVVVWIFREADEWRMGAAPGEITNRILVASTQPGAGEPGRHAPAASRPARARSDASATRPSAAATQADRR